MKLVKPAVILLLLTLCSSCSVFTIGPSAASQSLYLAIGQQPVLEKIVDNLITIIGQDDVVFDHFAESNVSHFRKKLTIFLCHITDGPCQYTGDTMQDIHRGMQISANQFNHFVELFIEAMNISDIKYPLQNKLLARLAPLRKNIIKI